MEQFQLCQNEKVEIERKTQIMAQLMTSLDLENET